jgi:hypothetical protein
MITLFLSQGHFCATAYQVLNGTMAADVYGY